MSIAVGWYNQTDATFPELGIEIVGGFGSFDESSTPLTAAQANTVLKHLDRDVANRIAESAFFTRIPIASAASSPLSVVDLGDGRLAYSFVSGGAFRTWTPAGEIDPSWTALTGSGVGVIGTLLDEGEAIWWNNSTTNSAVCAMYRTNGFASGGTIVNGTTSGTKAYHSFFKDGYGNYYRITDTGVLQAATSLGGTWTAVAAAGTVSSACAWGNYVVTVGTSLNAANAVKLLDNGVLVGSINPGVASAGPRKIAVVEDRVVIYGLHSVNLTNDFYLSAFGDPLDLQTTPKTVGVFASYSGSSLKFGVSGSVIGVNLQGGFAYSVDRGESWKLTSVGTCGFDGGKLYSGRTGSLKV